MSTLPTKIGRYEIIKQIGRGGMGIVYHARDPQLNRDVAIKVLRPDRRNSADLQERFTREAQALAQLDHPNIPPIYDYGEEGSEEDQYIYLVTSYLPGGSLEEQLQARQVFSIQETLHIAKKLLDALQYAHGKGFIHRDIKPSNILFKGDGTLVLSDFGIVKILADRSVNTPTGQILGTPAYMAPELFQLAATPQSDLYSVGVILYQMLTGTHPFIERRGLLFPHTRIRNVPRPVREANSTIPLSFEYIILKALEKDPQHRYQSASELLNALRVLESEFAEPTIPSVQPLLEKPQRGGNSTTVRLPKHHGLPKPLWYLVGAILLIVMLIGAIFFPGIATSIFPPLANLFPPSHVINIAISTPRSGEFASSGVTIVDGAQFAVDQVNQMHLLPAGYTINDVPFDDESNPSTGANKVRSAVNDALTAAIIGPYNSGVAATEIPITHGAPIAQISPANTDPCLTKDTQESGCVGSNDLLPMLRPTGPITYFRLPTTDDLSVKVLVNFLRARSYRTAYGVYNSQDLYSNFLFTLFSNAWRQAGGMFVGSDNNPDATSSQQYANQFQLVPDHPDVVFFAGTMPAAAYAKEAMDRLPQFNASAFAGGAGIMLNSFVQTAQKGGSIFAEAPFEDTAALQQFKTNYLAAGYSTDTYGPYTASAYDCVLIVAHAINTVLVAKRLLPPRGSWDQQGAMVFRQAVINAIASTTSNNITSPLALATNFQSFDKSSGDNTNPHVSIYQLNGAVWQLQE